MLNRLLFSSLLLLTGAVMAAAETRPNILYCLADDWSWPHAGVYGDRVIRTPTFDRVAREGMRFNYCFSASSSSKPRSTAAIHSPSNSFEMFPAATW